MEEKQKYQEFSFISKEIFKNGSRKLHFIEPELYKMIYTLGFRFVRIDKKPFMYRVDEKGRIKYVGHFQELRDEFCEFVKKLDMPENEINEILNAFYAQRPIKRNGLIEHYLTDTKEPGQYLIEELKSQKENC